MSELGEVRIDEIGVIFIVDHLDVVLELGMTNLSNGSLNL